MGTKVASLYADVTANIGNFMAGMGQVKGTLATTAGSMGKFNLSLAAVGIAASAAGLALSTAFELGTEGAQILNTQSAFENLTTSLGAGTDILGDLQEATRGTVSEMDLMRSTSTLLMGTSGDLGEQLAQNAPRLAEIAQAAHDLNPTMGTTADMFDRLARGIKKAEPELLDEVGILMNLTQVYKEYAAAHGTTATALTKTQKAEAMLNEVLKQGNTLVEQATNVNTQGSTSIDRYNASIEDFQNNLATRFTPIVAELAEFGTYLLTGTNSQIDAFRREQSQVGATAGSYEEYLQAKRDAITQDGVFINNQGMLVNAAGRVIDANYATVESFVALKQTGGGIVNLFGTMGANATYASSAFQGFSESAGMSSQAIEAWGQRLTETAEATHYNEQAMAVYGERMTALAGYYAELEAAEQNRITTAGLMAGIQGQLGDATTSYSNTISQLTTQEAQLVEQIDIATKRYGENSTQVANLNAALTQNREAQGGALAALQNMTAEMIFNQAAMGLDAQTALDLARNMGVLSEADYAVATSVQILREQFFNANTGMIEGEEAAQQYAAGIAAISQASANLQAKGITPTIEGIKKEMEAMAKSGASTEVQNMTDALTTPDFEDFAATAGEAAGALEKTADASKETDENMSKIDSSGGKAQSAITAAGNAAKAAWPHMRFLADTTGEVASNLTNLPRRTEVGVTVNGVDAAITELERLQTAIGNITTELTINVAVQSSTSAPTTYAPQVGETTYPVESVSYASPVTEIYNIYDPLAAIMLAETKRSQTVNKLEQILNG